MEPHCRGVKGNTPEPQVQEGMLSCSKTLRSMGQVAKKVINAKWTKQRISGTKWSPVRLDDGRIKKVKGCASGAAVCGDGGKVTEETLSAEVHPAVAPQFEKSIKNVGGGDSGARIRTSEPSVGQ